MGIEDSAVRSALSRFKRRGILVAEKRLGAAGYALSPTSRRTFDVGDARVLERRELPRDEGWVLAAFSIPESARDLRYRLRSRLAKVGFAQVTGGLWIAPRALEADVRNVAAALRVTDYVDVFRAEHLAFRPTTEAIREWWDLDGIAQHYTEFVREYSPLRSEYSGVRGRVDGTRAFVDYTRVLTSWRQLPYIDPGLPVAYLPRDWAGQPATELFFWFHDHLAEAAQQHVVRLCEGRYAR
jgi:phenylacetic acid degradation operon negative regulatory protein